jgi:hypothetical protein
MIGFTKFNSGFRFYVPQNGDPIHRYVHLLAGNPGASSNKFCLAARFERDPAQLDKVHVYCVQE